MTVLEVQIPNEVEMKITRLVDEGEFENFEQAVSEILSAGITAYQVNPTTSPDEDYDMGHTTRHDDEYIF